MDVYILHRKNVRLKCNLPYVAASKFSQKYYFLISESDLTT